MSNAGSRGDENLIACDVCLKEIPKSVARCDEGADYTRYFCGQDCYQKWMEQPGVHEIGVSVAGLAVDFETALSLAKTVADHYLKDAMPIAWFDRERGKVSPDVPECQHQPGWIAYAEGHGGDIKVDIDKGKYIFFFASGASPYIAPSR